MPQIWIKLCTYFWFPCKKELQLTSKSHKIKICFIHSFSKIVLLFMIYPIANSSKNVCRSYSSSNISIQLNQLFLYIHIFFNTCAKYIAQNNPFPINIQRKDYLTKKSIKTLISDKQCPERSKLFQNASNIPCQHLFHFIFHNVLHHCHIFTF